jgi:RNA recognition motif-containing protein
MKTYYAFVDFEDHLAAVEAIKQMNNFRFVNGEELSVQQSSM